MLLTKRAHQCTIFQTFECSNESSPNSSCHFWNHKIRVYSNFAPLFSVCIFVAQTLYTLLQKESIEKKCSDFWVVGWKFTNSSCHIWNHNSMFLQSLRHSSVLWEITLLYCFSWSFIWFGQKEPIKVQNFGLSTAYVKFHQICTLIGSFCWRYI